MLLSGIYVQWKSLVEKYMETFLDEEKEAVFGLNAINFYRLEGYSIDEGQGDDDFGV
jgi:L-fuconolactonase